MKKRQAKLTINLS